MRSIHMIVVHCAATKPSSDIDANEIRNMHVRKGWLDIGYHMVIRRNGGVEDGRPIEKEGAHAKGFNTHSIGICLIGGVDENNKPDFNYTINQMESLKRLLDVLKNEFQEAEVLGHRDLPEVAKACPCFNVKEWYV